MARGRPARWVLGAVVVVLAALPGARAPMSPLANLPLYVDPDTPAAAAARQSPGDGLDRIARQPTAHWLDASIEPDRIRRYVADYVERSHDRLPVLVAYAIPLRDCRADPGSFGDPAAYLRWIRELAAGIGDRPALVILEPDALANTSCLDATAYAERMALLDQAVGAFAAHRTVYAYLDAGNSHWLPTSEAVRRLREVRVDRIRGFSLNVSNFYPTDEERRFGDAVATRLGDMHYVVDTSRNGNGAPPDGPLSWCNPAGRALGTDPELRPAARVDALLWVKHPGESDGRCGRNEPPAGQWWPEYATSLLRNRR